MKTGRLLALGVVVASAAALGCGGDDPAGTEPTAIELTAYFGLNVSGQPILLNQPVYTNSSGTTYSIKKLRFVITDVTLHAGDGTSVEVADLHYFDLADASTQAFEYRGLPHAEWNRVTFTFGLDETDNLRDKYSARTKFHLDMQWPTTLGANLGYHYMQLEGDYATGPGSTSSYATHTGPRQLDGTNPDFPGVVDPAPHHFHFAVDLPFAPTHVHNEGHGELTIDFDLDDWYADHEPADGKDTEYDFADYPTQMIMGNLEAQGKLHDNGRFCFSATLESHGGHH